MKRIAEGVWLDDELTRRSVYGVTFETQRLRARRIGRILRVLADLLASGSPQA